MRPPHFMTDFWVIFFADTIQTQMMADKFNLLWSEIQNYIAEGDADVIPVSGE